MVKANGIQSGEIIGDRYCILYEIGRGRWSQTYLVRDRGGNRDRGVLKLFTPVLARGQSSARICARFDRVARELTRLQHPQIPKLKDFFATAFRKRECWCCVYESVEGLNFQELLQLRSQHGRRFKEEEVGQLLGQVLPVLAYLHQNGTTHGDLAPENLMLRQSDKVPMLIDFGALKQIAAVLKLDPNSEFYPGIAGYAPPEQVREGLVLTQSDVYALGKVAIALLSGREGQLWTGDWSQLRASAAFVEVLQFMVAPEPRARFADAEAALAAVRELFGEAEPAVISEPKPAESILLQAEENGSEAGTLPEGQETGIRAEEKEGEPVIFQERETEPSPVPQSIFKKTESPLTEGITARSGDDNLAAGSFSRIGKVKPETSFSAHPARSRDRVGWMLVKIILVCAFSLSSGTAGWWASRLWIDRNAPLLASEEKELFAPSKELSFLPADDPEPEPEASLPEAERQRKLALRDRRLRSGISYEYFTELTNELFWTAYPSQAGRNPSLAPEDSVWRDRWDNVGTDLLDRLDFLSLSARQRLGRYSSHERESAVRAAASLNLSEQALFDTTEALLAERFPEIATRPRDREPNQQIELAIAADLLRTLRSDKSLTPIALAPTAPISSSGTLQPGEVKAFFLELERGQTLSAFLDADLSVRFSVYNARGDRLLENHKLRSWSGQATESGIYTCILLSQSPVENPYNLTLTAGNSN